MIDTSSLMAMNSDSFIIFACEKAELVVHTANKGASNIPLNRVRRALFLQEPEQRIPARWRTTRHEWVWIHWPRRLLRTLLARTPGIG